MLSESSVIASNTITHICGICNRSVVAFWSMGCYTSHDLVERVRPRESRLFSAIGNPCSVEFGHTENRSFRLNMQGMHPFELVLHERFEGVIDSGEHDLQDGAACALEAASLARGRRFSDRPTEAGLPTLWPISDGLGIWPDDQTRTKHVVPLVKSLWGWPQWSKGQQKTWKGRVVQRTIQEILSCIIRTIGLEAEAERCALDGNLEAALAARAAAKRVVEAARKTADSIRMLDAVRAKEAAHFVVIAASSRDEFNLAYAAYSVASSVLCMAIGRATSAVNSNLDTPCYKVDGVSAVEILSLTCRIWREEAERIRQPRSS